MGTKITTRDRFVGTIRLTVSGYLYNRNARKLGRVNAAMRAASGSVYDWWIDRRP